MSEIFDFLLRHWELSTLFLILVIAYMYLELRERISGMAQVTPEQAVQMMNHQGAMVLDVRTEQEFNDAHIINSVHIPVADLEQKSSKLNAYKNKKMILVTGSNQSALSEAVKKLQTTGAKDFDFSILQGGIASWRTAQLPVQKKHTEK